MKRWPARTGPSPTFRGRRHSSPISHQLRISVGRIDHETHCDCHRRTDRGQRAGPARLGSTAGQPGRGGPPNPLLQAFDTDHDGTLSASEIDAAAAKLRERDANKDGKLTADELPRGGGGRGQGGRGGPAADSGAMEADERVEQADAAQR